MKAVVFNQFGSVENLSIKEVQTPVPADDEVQIHVKYAGVNPVDWKIHEGYLKNFLPHEFPIIPGWDAAGTVSALGKNATKFKMGDEVFVYCRKPVVHMGSYAEYVCFPAENVAFKPKNISMAQAASLPLVALTAWQALFEFAKLKKGQTVLIHAGAGGVGSLAIGFAKSIGAKVYTTASKKNHTYVKKLGADVAIDYNEQNFVEAIKSMEPHGVDVVFDCVGGQTLEDSYQLVKKDGNLVSIVKAPEPEKGTQFQINVSYAFVRPDGAQLKQIAELLEAGKMQPPAIHEYPLSKFADALSQVRTLHTQGKVVLAI